MNCRKASRLIQDYLDGDVSAWMSRHLHSHLDNCPKCARELKSYQEVVALLESNLMQEPPEKMAALIRAQLPERHPAAQGRKMGRLSCYMVWTSGVAPAGLMGWIQSGLNISVRAIVSAISHIGGFFKAITDLLHIAFNITKPPNSV